MVRCGVPGRDEGILRPGMFAVGGGMKVVRFCPEAGEFLSLVPSLSAFPPGAFCFDGGVPPYFSNSCCVVLYLVAFLSFSIVASLCFWRSVD